MLLGAAIVVGSVALITVQKKAAKEVEKEDPSEETSVAPAI